MGIVYRVRDSRLDRPTALKVIRPSLSTDDQFRLRFYRESRLAASIRHRNVVTVYRSDEWDGVLYLAMELIEGMDLGALLSVSGPLAPRLACPLLAQVGQALDAAHERGLVHRDVKPANVLLDQSIPVHAYLSDFGLTKERATNEPITNSGAFLGTVAYAAPEQIRRLSVDARTDVYALGCLLFAMLTGKPPFTYRSDVETMFAHVNDPVPSISDRTPGLPPALDGVLEHALAKDPDDRYDTTGELSRAAIHVLRRFPASFAFQVEPSQG